MTDPHALLTDEQRQQEAEAEREISDSLNRFVQETAEKLVGAAEVYCSGDPKTTVQVACTVAESILIAMLHRLPIAPGNEVKILQQMKKNVGRRMAQARLLRGPAQGNG